MLAGIFDEHLDGIPSTPKGAESLQQHKRAQQQKPELVVSETRFGDGSLEAMLLPNNHQQSGANSRLPMVNGAWKTWVLELPAKDRNQLAKHLKLDPTMGANLRKAVPVQVALAYKITGYPETFRV